MTILYETIAIKGNLSSRTVRAMIDSGSERTLISPYVASVIGAKPTGSSINLMLSDGSVLSGVETEVVIVIDRCEIPVVAIIFDGLPEDLVLGADFLRKTGAVVEFANEHLIFNCPAGYETWRID